MPDPIRPHPPDLPPGEPDRDATIEGLLHAGLECYFRGEYERAVHAWTRVLFLDRSHARARAYIDRARLLLAERQRESDEALHEAMAALDAGETARARQLLDQALAKGAHEAQGLNLRDRLERLEPPVVPSVVLDPPPGSSHPPQQPAPPVRARRATSRRWLAACLAAGVLIAVAWPSVVQWATVEVAPTRARVPAAPDPPLPVPRVSDLLIARAASLFERGHLHEALEVLDDVRPADPRRPDADRLAAEIQRVLLDGADAPPAPSGGRPAAPDQPR